MNRAFAICIVITPMLVSCQADAPQPAGETSAAARVEYGRYLVQRVAMCDDCHTARDETGQFVEDRRLWGAKLFVEPLQPMPDWATVAPAIAGLPGYGDIDVVHLLERGEFPGGRRLRPPMPPYRMTRQDAAAVVAYLRTLGVGG